MSAYAPRSNRPIDVITGHPWWTVLAVLAVVVAVLALLWDWNWFKGPVERQVEARTGRTFRIAGSLDVDPGRITTIRADGLTLGNAAWADEPLMASATRLELRVETLPLLWRDVRIAEIRLAEPRLRLETGPDGEGNWSFGDDDDGGEPLQPRRLWIDDGRLRYVDAGRRIDIHADIDSVRPERTGAAAPVAIEGSGEWAGNAFTLDGRAESLLGLQHADKPYHVDLRAAAGATRAHARGNLVDPLRFDDIDVQFALSGQDLEDLFPLVGIALPPTPPYSLDGRLRHTGDTWRYDGFTGEVGDSDLSGSASVEAGGERLFLRADLVSKRLDFDDLAGFVGGIPRAEGDGDAAPAADAPDTAQATDGRVLPDTPYELDRLRAMDADVRLRAQRINAPSLPLDDMDAHFKLDDGLLRLDPLNFGVAGGDIRSTIRMDAREKTIRTRADITAKGLDLGRLFPGAELTDEAVGRIGGHVAIAGSGNSVAKMLGSADGDIAIGMGRGRISNLLIELAGIDIYESLKFLIGEDRQVPVRCAFGDFAVRDGVMTSRALAFDTTDTIIVGEGTVDLGEETLDLVLKPRPKDRSILALRSPLVVGGTFADPSFRPDFKRLGLRGAIALALGSIAPPAALLATIETGGGEDVDCGGQYAK